MSPHGTQLVHIPHMGFASPHAICWSSAGSAVVVERVVHNSARAVTELCCSGKIVEWNRSKWLGYEIALDGWLQNHVVNGLGLYAWDNMMQILGHKKPAPAIADSSVSSTLVDAIAAPAPNSDTNSFNIINEKYRNTLHSFVSVQRPSLQSC